MSKSKELFPEIIVPDNYDDLVISYKTYKNAFHKLSKAYNDIYALFKEYEDILISANLLSNNDNDELDLPF